MIVSHSQIVELPEIGKFTALLDTGNGTSACSIDSQIIDDFGDTIVWSCNGQEFKNEVVDRIKVKVGQDIEIRPVIELDLRLCDRLIRKVRFTPVDRSNKSYTVLINRDVMSNLGISVSANESYVFKFNEFIGNF